MENKKKQLNDDDANNYYKQGNSFLQQDQNKEALQMYNKAIEINPNSAGYYYHKGICLDNLGQNKEALQMYNKAIQINPNNANYYNGKGICLQSQGENEEALQMYNKAIQINPNNANYYYSKGTCLQKLFQNEEALQMYNKAIQINPNEADYYSNKGNVLKYLGQNEEALLMFNKAIQINPNDADYYLNKGICLSNLCQNEEALQMYNKAIQIKPNSAGYYYNKGICLYKIGQNEEALSMYNKAILINPNNEKYYNGKANCLEDLGQNEEALSMFNKAIQTNPLYLLPHANKAVLLNKIGKTIEARECIQICSKLMKQGHTKGLSNPNIKFIQQTIDLLEKIEIENGNILKKVEQIGGKLNEKQSLYNVAKKFTNLLTKISEQQVVNNLAQNNQDKPQENKIIDLQQIQDKQNLIKEELNYGNKTLAQVEQYFQDEITKLQVVQQQQQEKINEQGSKINSQQNKINQQQNEIQVLKVNVVEINGVLIDGGVKQKAELNRELQDLLQTEEESVINYYKTFYWTSLNILQTYRIISTNLVSGNYKSDASEFLENHGDKIEEGLQVCLDAGKEICKGVISSIPIVGNIFNFLDKTISAVVSSAQKYQDKKDQIQFQNKINAINQVICSKFQTDEQLSIKLAQLAIKLTKLRKHIINFPPSKQAQKGSILSWVSNQISKVEASHFNKTELHDLNDEGVKLALQDVVLLISYIALYSDRIINIKKQDIVDILFDIVDKQLDGLSAIELNEQPANNSKNINPFNQQAQNNVQANDKQQDTRSLKKSCQCNIF